MTLASAGLVTESTLRARATEALGYFVGNKADLMRNIEVSCRTMAAARSRKLG